MTSVMLSCPRDGIVYTDSLIPQLGAYMSFEIQEGVLTTCPVCGDIVPAVAGDYWTGAGEVVYRALRPTDDQREAIMDPTPAQARQLRTVFDWAVKAREDASVDDEIIAERLEAAVARVPGGKSLLDRALGARGAGLASWLAFLLALVMYLTGDSGGVTLSEEQFEQLLNAATQQSQPLEPSTQLPGDSTREVHPPGQSPRDSGPEAGITRPRS